MLIWGYIQWDCQTHKSLLEPELRTEARQQHCGQGYTSASKIVGNACIAFICCKHGTVLHFRMFVPSYNFVYELQLLCLAAACPSSVFV